MSERAGGALGTFSAAWAGESGAGDIKTESCVEVGVTVSDTAGIAVLCGVTEQHP